MARLPPDLAAAGGGESAGDGPPLPDIGVAAGRPSAASTGVGPATKDLTFCSAPSTEKSTTPISPARREKTLPKSRKKSYKNDKRKTKGHAFEAKTPLGRRGGGGGEARGADFSLQPPAAAACLRMRACVCTGCG